MGLVTAARDAIAAQNPKPLPHFFSWATREVEPRGLLFSSSCSSCSSSHTKQQLRSSLMLSLKIRTRFPNFFFLIWSFTSRSLSVCFPKLFAPNPLPSVRESSVTVTGQEVSWRYLLCEHYFVLGFRFLF